MNSYAHDPLSQLTQSYTAFEKDVFTQVNLMIGYSQMLLDSAAEIDSPERLAEIEKMHRLGKNILAILSSELDPLHIQQTITHFAAFHHLIDSPLTQINVQAQFLINEIMDTEYVAMISDLEKIRDAAQALSTLIDSMPAPPEVLSLEMEPSPTLLGQQPCLLFSESSTPQSSFFESKLLIIDEQELTRTMFSRRLSKKGYHVHQAPDIDTAWYTLEQDSFDLLLIDADLAQKNQAAFLRKLKAQTAYRDIPIILLTLQEDPQNAVHALMLGAEDCLTRSCDSILMRTRIEALLEKKRMQDREKEILRNLQASEASLQQELSEAAHYVYSLLPHPTHNNLFSIEWKFLPSARLGGDSFGYHLIDADHWAFYLLDVCGHGVGAALLSVSVLHVLQTHTNSQINFASPDNVLKGLNEAFRSEKHNGMYFTIWYGVYHIPSRTLHYVNGGHPPAILLRQEHGQPKEALRLSARGSLIGVFQDVEFEVQQFQLQPRDRLVIFSDGAQELFHPDGHMLTFEEFITILQQSDVDQPPFVDQAFERLKQIHGKQVLEDDYSMLSVQFA